MHPEIQALKTILDEAYSRNKKPVAYIDESYQSSREGPPFYLTSGVLVQRAEVHELRNTCLEIANSLWWHTTSAFQENEKTKIQTFLNLLSTPEISNFSAVQIEIFDNDLEHARRECLIQLCQTFESAGCGMVVIERRQSQSSRRSDVSLFASAVRDGYISQHFKILQSSPSVEQLLWLPDVLSWSMRRNLALGDNNWISKIQENTTIVDVSTNQALIELESDKKLNKKMKRPQRAVAKGCDPAKPIGSENEVVSRSSELIMPHGFDILQDFPQNLGTFVAPPFNPAELSEWIRSKFPR